MKTAAMILVAALLMAGCARYTWDDVSHRCRDGKTGQYTLPDECGR